MKNINTCLWFNNEGEEAANFYTSIFPDSEIRHVARYPEGCVENHGQKAETFMTIEFSLSGHTYLALNGGPHFKFHEAASQVVNCETQEEIDYFWEKLSAGGDPSAQKCGWLKDKYGQSWQVIPTLLKELFATDDSAKASRAMNAMLTMKKIDITLLIKAAEQRPSEQNISK